MIRTGLSILLLSLSVALSAQAGIDVTTPLGTYYQPGRYLPVRVQLSGGPAADVTIRADGVVPTVVSADALAGGQAVMAPSRPVTGAATQLEVSAPGHASRTAPLVRVPEGERLVAVVGSDADVAFA